MNSYERLFQRMEGGKVDKLPNLNILMSFAAKYSNIPYSSFCTDPDKMVEANILCHEKFGIDAVTTMSDPYAETSDYGAEIEYAYDSNPICRYPFLKEYHDINKLKVRDIGNTGRMYKRVITLQMYSDILKGECPIIGWVEGALAEFADLRGINEAMVDLIDEPGFSKDVMEICTEQAILFAKAQIEAGADIIGVGDAAASLVGGVLYRDMILPYEKRIIDSIHSFGGKAKLHICGNITPLLDYVCETGADIIDIDWMVDLKNACTKFNGRASANGNFDPVNTLLLGNPDTIKRKVLDCIDNGDNFSIISAGCEVPRDTPAVNLSAVNEALTEASLA